MRNWQASIRGRRALGRLAAGAVLSVGLLAPAATLSPLTPTASAAPGDGLSVSFAELGRATDVALPRDSSATLVTIPVPDGLTAEAITGRLRLPSDLREGWIEVSADGQRLQRIGVTAGDVDEGVPFSVSLAGVRVLDRSLTISMASRYVPIDERCYSRAAFAPFSLQDTAVQYSGEERQPAAVAEFFPPLLRKLTILVPRDSDQVTQTAALALSAEVVHEYGSQPVEVAIEQLPADGAVPALAPGLFERTVVLGRSEGGVITLQRAANGLPVLMITGDEATLLPQIHLLAANFDGFWSASKALTAPDERIAKVSEDAMTLDQLGIYPLTASGLEHFAVPISFTQSQLGRPVADLQARLFGTYVPLPGSRNGTLSVNMGPTKLASLPLDGSGKFDLDIAVPAELLARSISMSVDVDVTGDFDCAIVDGASISIDPRSFIDSNVASSPLPGGFESLPQALLPAIDVGLKDGGFSDLQRAALLIVELQRMSYMPLSPQVIGFEEAVSSGQPTLLIAATGDLPTTLDLPITTVDPVLLTMNGVASNDPVATVQTVHSGGRTTVVASSNGDPADLDALLAWVAQDKRVQGLAGDLLVGPRGEVPFTLAVDVEAAAPLGVEDPDGGLSVAAISGIIVGTGALILVAVGGTLWLRRREQ